jgi:hypothetical protein
MRCEYTCNRNRRDYDARIMMATEQPLTVMTRIDRDLAKKIQKFRSEFAKKNQGEKLSTSAVIRMALQKFMENQS